MYNNSIKVLYIYIMKNKYNQAIEYLIQTQQSNKKIVLLHQCLLLINTYISLSIIYLYSID